MFEERLKNIYLAFLDRDRKNAEALVELLKFERDRYLNLLIHVSNWDDARFLQGVIKFINTMLDALEAKDGGFKRNRKEIE